MQIYVETLSKEGADVTADFELWRDAKGAVRVELIEAFIDSKPLGEIDLKAMGVFDILVEKAMDEFDLDELDAAEHDIEGDHGLDLMDDLAEP